MSSSPSSKPRSLKKHLLVVGAVVMRDGLTLCARRGPTGPLAGLWEFPGGKIEAGETAAKALEREIREELLCDVEVCQEVTTTVHEYSFAVVELTTFYCVLVSGTPQLTEHAETRWVAPSDLLSLEWAPADVPAVELISRKSAL